MKRKPGRPKGSHGNFETDAKIIETGKMTINYRADLAENQLYEIIGRLYVESQTEKAVWTAPEAK